MRWCRPGARRDGCRRGGRWSFLWNFFFQAEDGIRDADVTGVQTCALPISRRSHGTEAIFWWFGGLAMVSAALCITRRNPVFSGLWLVVTLFSIAALFVILDARSEERRVGKECTSRLSRHPRRNNARPRRRA